MNINDNVFTEDVSLSNIPSSKDKARAKSVTDSVDVVNSLVYPKGNITRSLSVPEVRIIILDVFSMHKFGQITYIREH